VRVKKKKEKEKKENYFLTTRETRPGKRKEKNDREDARIAEKKRERERERLSSLSRFIARGVSTSTKRRAEKGRREHLFFFRSLKIELERKNLQTLILSRRK
jgi:hypothetical protein